MRARIYITLKDQVLDPQGQVIKKSLSHLDFDGVEDVRQGKVIDIKLTESDIGKAEKKVEEMCKKLLVNEVIEDFSYDILK